MVMISVTSVVGRYSNGYGIPYMVKEFGTNTPLTISGYLL